MHLPNYNHDGMPEFDAVVGADGAVTLLHLNMGWFPKLRHNRPNRLLHIRMYTPDWTKVDPSAWADQAVSELGKFGVWDDPCAAVSSANEQNLHYECGDGDPANQWKYQTADHYTRIARWDMAFWRRVDELVPRRKALRASPAFAYGHDAIPGTPGSEYQVSAVQEMMEASDILCAHPYAQLNWDIGPLTAPGGQLQYYFMCNDFRPAGWKNSQEPNWVGRDPGGLLAQFPHKPVLFSECGTFSHGLAAKTPQTWGAIDAFYRLCVASSQVIGCTWFIWNSGKEHRDNLIYPNETLRRLFVDAPRYAAPRELPVARERPAPPAPPPPASPPPAPPPPAPPPPPPPSPEMTQLANFPLYNQLDDWTTDADGVDENRWNNCGPECVAMCVRHITGVELPADYVKDVMYGQPYVGYTFIPKLVDFLERRCSIPCDTYAGNAQTVLRPVVTAALDQGYPVIALIFLDRQKLTGGHFVVAYGYSDTHVRLANPLGGFIEDVAWPEFERIQSYAQAVVLKRSRSF
jgi:hypothetical protein